MHSRSAAAEVLRRLPVLLICTALGGVAGLFLSTRGQDPYRATATVIVTAGDSAGGAALVASLAPLARSAPVVTGAAQRIGATDSAAELRRRVHTSVPKGTALLRISVDDDSAVSAAGLANGIAEEFASVVAAMGATALGAPTQVTVIEEATAPDSPRTQVEAAPIAIGAGIGLVAGLAGIALRRATDDRLRGAEALSRSFGLMPLGVIDRRRRRTPLFPTVGASESEIAQQLFELQVVIDELIEQTSARTLAVVGVGERSDAAWIAANIAATSSLGGRAVALVDADIRDAALTGLLRATADSPRTTDLLFGGRTVGRGDLIHLGVADVRLLPTNAVAAHPSTFVRSDTIGTAFAPLASDFGLVVVAAAKLDASHLVPALASAVDAVILVVADDMVTDPEGAAAVSRLRRAGALPAGFVITRRGRRNP